MTISVSRCRWVARRWHCLPGGSLPGMQGGERSPVTGSPRGRPKRVPATSMACPRDDSSVLSLKRWKLRCWPACRGSSREDLGFLGAGDYVARGPLWSHRHGGRVPAARGRGRQSRPASPIEPRPSINRTAHGAPRFAEPHQRAPPSASDRCSATRRPDECGDDAAAVAV